MGVRCARLRDELFELVRSFRKPSAWSLGQAQGTEVVCRFRLKWETVG